LEQIQKQMQDDLEKQKEELEKEKVQIHLMRKDSKK
jgi:hypothetical protein